MSLDLIHNLINDFWIMIRQEFEQGTGIFRLDMHRGATVVSIIKWRFWRFCALRTGSSWKGGVDFFMFPQFWTLAHPAYSNFTSGTGGLDL